MCNYKIKQLDNVLKELNNERITILSYDAETHFTIPGHNFGSLILNLAIEYRNEKNDGEKKSSRIVAKCIPESEDLRAIFQVQVTFRKELEIYSKIIPALKAFQIEKNSSSVLDIFPDFYGGRINLTGHGPIDEDGIILLENLKLSGYSNGDRSLGFNYETTASILEDLAVFHAVPIALKITNPEKFEESVMSTLKLHLDPTDDDILGLVNKIVDLTKKYFPETVTKRVEKALKKSGKNFVNPMLLPVREPFATMIHNDFWVNNILNKFEDQTVKNKMIDFQLIDYGSPARDVLFFLFSSVQISTLKENYDKFLIVYHNKFLETLEEFGCDTNPFSFQSFEFELSEEAKNYEFFHLIFMLSIFYSDSRDLKELKEWQGSDFLEMKVITEKYEEKAIFLIRQFVQRKWL